jgi:AraC-like DNA-binding protein
MLGAVDRSFTTGVHRAERQFDVWRDLVAEAFAPVDVERGASAAWSGFAADCRARGVSVVTVSALRAESQQVDRTEAQAARAPCGMYFLNLPVDSGSVLHQDGRTALLAPGDFAIVDGDRPFRLEFPDTFRQISLTIPKIALEHALCDAGDATARTISGREGIGALAAAAFTALAAHAGEIDGRAGEAAALHVIGLLAAALDAHAPAPVTRRATLYRALLEDIERHYGDPDLTLVDMTRRIAISSSYATKLFAENGTSFGRHLLARRLDHAWVRLVREQQRSITDIAIGCGFTDPAHFSRAFRARFGMTPTDRRRAAADRLGHSDPMGLAEASSDAAVRLLPA